MEPQNFVFGGGVSQTTVNPLAAVGLLIAIVLLLTTSRNKGITPLLISCFTIPLGNVVVLGGLHFTLLRFLIIAGLIRRAQLGGSSSNGKFPGGFNGIDRVVILWVVALQTIFSIEWMEMQVLIHALGDFLDMFGGYLVVRFFIPDGEAVRRAIRALGIVALIQGAFMLNEQINHVNLFGYIGGPGPWLTIRDGRIRSEGVLTCIAGGAFAGALIPLFLGLWTERKSRMFVICAIIGATTMVFTSNSSTSFLALGSSLLGLAFWPLRKKMTMIRQGFWLTLVALHLVMKAPVWALIARVDVTGSSSGYHRYELVDNCIRHFGQWWLLGYKDYPSWGFCMFDLCDQFVVQAVIGGLLALVAYIMIFKRAFGAIGKARRKVQGDRSREWLIWCLGSTLFSVVVAHLGINYGAVTEMWLFTLWSCISIATFEAMRPAEAKVVIPDDPHVASVPDLVSA